MFDSKDHKPKSLDAEKENSSSLSLEQVEVAQLVEFESLSHLSKPSTGLNLIQQKADAFSEVTNLELLQKKTSSKGVYGHSSAGVIQAKGLPKNLQTGVENLSGQAMNDVNVHYNSKQPEKMGAHAFAQGTDIHLGKGQEKHLPHEAWHVVQQKEGRVKPTVQKKEKIPVNDDASLEKEADMMGDKALSLGKQEPEHPQDSVIEFPQKTVQKVEDEENQKEESEQESEEKVSENENKAEASDANSEGEDNKDQDSSAQVEIKPETLVLSGTKGLYAKVSSFFGKETSFGVLQNLIKEYENTEDDVVKEELKPKIVGACDTWLKKHPKPKKSKSLFGKLKSGFNRLRGKTKNDDKKRQSIELIKKRFSETKKASDIKLTTLADKQSITSKIKGVFGFKTTFKQIEDQYHQYQSEASSISSFSSLLEVLEKAKQIFMLIDQWKQSHTELTDKDEKTRFDSLTKIENGILNLFFQTNFKNIITLKVSKLSLSQLRKNKVAMEELELTINIEGKKITGKGEDIVLTKEGVDFSKLTIDYNDNIEITEGFEVSKPKLMVSHQGENYSVTASGGLSLNMEIPNAELSAQGGVEVTFNTQTAKFSSPKLSNAEISASLFGDNLELSASGIDYSDGVFTAKSGSATLKHFDVNSNIEDLTFSKKDGFDWSKIEINVDKEIGVGGVVSIENASGMVKGKSENYAYEISGDLGVNVPLPDGFSLEASGNVIVSGNPIENDYNVSVNGDGEINMSLGDVIKANAKQISFDKSKEELSAGSTSLTVNILGKTIVGDGENIIFTKEGVDFSKLTIDYNDNIKITEGLEVSNPKLVVSHEGENYNVIASGGISLSMEIPNAELSAQGGVEATYNTQTAKFSSPKLSNAEISASLFGGNLELSASEIDYSDGVFTAKSGSATLKHFDVNSNIEDLTFSKKDGFDWSKIEINVDKEIGVGGVVSIENASGMVKGKSENYAYEISGDLGVNVPLPDGFSLEASGNVIVSGNPIENDYNVSVNGDGEINMSLGDVIKANAKQISFDKSKEELSAGSASLSLNLFQNKNSADLKSLKVSKKDGVDWDSATFKFDKIGLDGLVSVKDVVATVKGKNDNYEKNAEGTLDLDSNLIPGTTINAEGIQVSMNVKDGKWSFGLNGDRLSVIMLNDSLKLISSKLRYENKKFEMETLEAFLSLPGRTIQAEGSNVIIEKDNIDWDQIKFPVPKILPKLGPLEFDNGDAIIKGKKESYALGLDVKSSFESENINWLSAEGKASLLWNYREKKLPEVTEYDLNVNAKSPKIPDAFLPPGTWPISFSLVMPFAAGPVPMEAEVGFEASAGASLGLSGSIKKMGDSTNISAQGTGNAEVVISIVGSVGVGSKYLVKLAGFLKGSAIANAGLSLGLNGEINNEFNFVSLEGDYSVDANFMAKLSAGLEAKALLIFQKTLYEVTLKKWELGSSKKEGKYDFLENKEKESQTTGLFKGRNISKDDLNNAPEVQHNTKEYLQAMEKFSKILNEENSSQKIEESDDKEALFDSSIINQKKTKLVNVLEAVIDENLSNKEFLKFKKKITKDENKLNRKKELHKEQMERQYEKLEAAKEGKLSKYKTLIKGRNEDHYKRKIERLKNEYKSKVEKDLIKLAEYRMKTDIYQNQINTASTYLSNIDPILDNPELSISLIDQQISEYREINQRANEQRYSIENYLTDLDFANANIDYED